MDHTLSFGAELELSDIDRRIDVPSYLGSYEGPKIAGWNLGCEIDICNTKGKWKGVATDPLCERCPVGGEINTVPSYFIGTQFRRILGIINLFPSVGVSCVNHGHIHVGIKDIWSDLEAVKNIFRYTEKNEKLVLANCCGYNPEEANKILKSDKISDWAKDYLLVGDAKTINPELYRAVEAAETVEDVREALETIECLNYCWVTGETKEAPGSHRTCVNLYNLLKGTIEFRVFRATLNPVEIYSALLFSKRYVEEALKGDQGTPVIDLLKELNYRFAPLNFDEDLVAGWEATRTVKDRSNLLKKLSYARKYREPYDPSGRVADDEFENSLDILLEMCKADVSGMTLSFG